MKKETVYVDHIDDEGTVMRINIPEGTLKVKLEHGDDCGTCPAARLCNIAGGGKSDTMELPVRHPERFHVGERVTLRGTEQMHRKAIMLCTVLPCIVLIAVMVAVYLLTFDQLAAALAGAGATVFFFIILYAMRNRIAHEFVFEVVKKEES